MRQSAAEDISFYDNHPEPADFYSEVIEGLGRKRKIIPPKFFYDAEGSRLFDAICGLPEYYPTRTEMQILRDNAADIAGHVGEDCLLVEPGSGSSHKVRLLLDSIRPSAYMPMDISKDHLIGAAQRVSAEYPWLDVHATCADFTEPLDLPYEPPQGHTVAFFPGSSIGNFEPERAVEFLANIAAMVGKQGGLLIGVDLVMDHEILNAAYNDSQGVTAAFNRNLLVRINRELGADFDVDSFDHHAFYNAQESRVEMHLVSEVDQVVCVNSHRFEFAGNETIHTENSYKYSIEAFQTCAREAGFSPINVWTDAQNLFSVHYLEVGK
ncbi:MAG: L-histidine N(alpha)-methyltransferase [Pseudomonadota bacterium]|nr:MAG: L-histidine N(alpha)-methyltransferase [Pseudomonadota bacterium]